MTLNEICAGAGYWEIQLTRHSDGTWSGYAQTGDFNCPYQKEFDPADGHGVSQVWVEDELPTAEEVATALIAETKTITPGKPYPPKAKP